MVKLILDSWKALRFALIGFKFASEQRAFRLELLLSVILVPLGCILGNTGIERALLLGSWLMVLVVELLNSAIETAIDRVGREHHILSGKAKDLAAAAVLMSFGVAGMIWILVIF